MYNRKTFDEYEIQGYYSLGWEAVAREETLKEARQTLKDYNENEKTAAHRIVKYRIRKEGL